jgi:hypothetical protein
MGTFLAILIGTILGGLLVGLPAAEKFVSGALMLFALLGALTSLFVKRVRIAAPSLVISYNPVPNFKMLWNIIRERRDIYYAILAISWFWFFGAAVLSVLPVYCKDFLGVDEHVVTLFLAMFTVGIGMGSLLCEKLSFKRVELGLVPIGTLGMTLFLADLFFCRPGWSVLPGQLLGLHAFFRTAEGPRLAVDFFLMSVFGGFFILPLYTLMQERSHSESRSRVIAANNILNAVYMVAASASVMIMNALKLSYPQIFLVMALANLIACLPIYLAVPEFFLRTRGWIRERLGRSI